MGRRAKVVGWVGGILLVVVLGSVYLASQGSDELSVDAPDPADQQTVVTNLDRAATAQGICYGWRLMNRSTQVSLGSNLGAGISVDSDLDRCAQYIEVRGTLYTYPDSSDSDDFATFSITTNILSAGHKVDPNAFTRLGLTTTALLDDPTNAILDAAQMLPLIALEAGVTGTPAPEPSTTGTASPAPLASQTGGGSDLWRDRWGLLVASGALLLAAVGTLLLGIRASRRARAVPADISGRPR